MPALPSDWLDKRVNDLTLDQVEALAELGCRRRRGATGARTARRIVSRAS
jgi:hypothetical protein